MTNNSTFFRKTIIAITLLIFLFSCSVQKKIGKEAQHIFLEDSMMKHAHIGISIYEPATRKYWYNHDAEKYFIPASNTKLFSWYTGMKYLGDSLPGIKILESEDKVYISGTGDPTLLHPDFTNQPVFKYLQGIQKPIWAVDFAWRDKGLGMGWAWDDYSAGYMAERSGLPVYGNVIRFSGSKENIKYFPRLLVKDSVRINYFNANGFISSAQRDQYSNNFSVSARGKNRETIEVPFITSSSLSFDLLADTLQKTIQQSPEIRFNINDDPSITIIRSQHSDSFFRIMMQRSDNFFAEQTLLMVSNQLLGYMNTRDIIAKILKDDLKNLPQPPKWVDGSGLSRYNLFSPYDFVYLLDKIKNETDWTRIITTLPTGGKGTLGSYYMNDAGFIYAKTGTLSNHVALSGYLITRKNKLLIFSIMANHFNAPATPVRKAIEKFLQELRTSY